MVPPMVVWSLQFRWRDRGAGGGGRRWNSRWVLGRPRNIVSHRVLRKNPALVNPCNLLTFCRSSRNGNKNTLNDGASIVMQEPLLGKRIIIMLWCFNSDFLNLITKISDFFWIICSSLEEQQKLSYILFNSEALMQKKSIFLKLNEFPLPTFRKPLHLVKFQYYDWI